MPESAAHPSPPSGDAAVCDVHAHYLPRDALDLMAGGPAVVGLDEVCGVAENITLNSMPVGATIDMLCSVASMLDMMDACGVTRRVLSPPPFTYRYWSDPADGLRLCRLLNDAIAAVAAARPDRFTALATVPLQDPDLAVAEFERATGDLGMAGVSLGTNVGGRHLADPAVQPFLSAVAAHGAPVLVHPDFVPNPRWQAYYLINLVGLPTETALCISELILSGTLARLPQLRLCFVHGGGSFPYLLGRLDCGWRVRPETRQSTAAPPSGQLGNLFFDTLTHDPQGLRFLLDTVGADHVIVGTDAPFDVEDPDPLAHVLRCPGLTDRERDDVLAGSARRWLAGVPAAVTEAAL